MKNLGWIFLALFIALVGFGIMSAPAKALTYGELQNIIVADGYRCDGIVKVYRGYPPNRLTVVCTVMAYKKTYNVEIFQGGYFIVPAG